MNRTVLNDERLSWKAKGLHAYMLSMPDDWVFYNEELAKHSSDGLSVVKSCIKELKQHGYLVRKSVKDDKGKILSWETHVYESPEVDFPPTGQTTDRETHPVDNRPLLSTDVLPSINNKLNTDKDIYTQYAEFVKMKESEYTKLVEEHGEPLTKKMIEVLDNYKGSNGKKYKSDYRAILNWVADKVKGEKNGRFKQGSGNPNTSEYDWLSL
jgi:hypothetical protein